MGAVDTQSILGESFNGKTVGVPAEAALNVVAPHGLVTGDHVLDGTGKKVTVMGQTGGKGRTVVKDVFVAAFALFEGLVEDLIFFPEFEDLSFKFRKIHLIGNIFESHINFSP